MYNIYIYIYIYIYILECSCAYTCTEEGGSECSGYDREVDPIVKFESQILSQILLQILSQILSQILL